MQSAEDRLRPDRLSLARLRDGGIEGTCGRKGGAVKIYAPSAKALAAGLGHAHGSVCEAEINPSVICRRARHVVMVFLNLRKTTLLGICSPGEHPSTPLGEGNDVKVPAFARS
jgi:hypothetical protein